MSIKDCVMTALRCRTECSK